MIGIILKILPMLGMLKGKAKLIGGCLAVLSVLGTYWYIEHLQNDISELEGTVILLEVRMDTCHKANADNMSTILELRGANSSLARFIEVSEDVRISAANAAGRRDLAAAEAIRNTKRELEELRNANPTCDQLAKIDMGIACPAVVERLRLSAGTDSPD